MAKADDGTQQWLDEMAMNRIRKRQGQQQQQQPMQQMPRQQLIVSEQRSYPAMERRVGQQQPQPQQYQQRVQQQSNGRQQYSRMLPGETPQDAVRAKEYAEKTYMKVPHVIGPLYAAGAKYLRERGADAASLKTLSQTVSVNTDVDNLSGRINSVIMQKFGAGDSQDALYARMHPNVRAQVSRKMEQLEKGEWVAPNTLLPQLQQQQNNGVQQGNMQTCKIISGYAAFQKIESQGFGSTIPLVRALGQIPPQMTGVDFVVREVVKAYIVQPNETTINLAAIQANPQVLVELVVLQPPPMSNIGMLLVQKEAIANGMGGGRQVLTDARQRTLGPQQQYLHQQNQRQQMAVPQQYRQQPQQYQQPQMINANNQARMNGRGLLKG